jgi:hypothetical protein
MLTTWLTAIGCVQSTQVQCGELVCGEGQVCIEDLGGCYSPEAISACEGAGDGTMCTTPALADGVCVSEVCMVPTCGDGVVTVPEECDGANLLGQSCQDLGFYDVGVLSCNAQCKFDKSQCTGFCGDALVGGNEDCDGADLGGVDCTGLGYYQPAGLTCTGLCSFDDSLCQEYCGDGVVNGAEICDGALPQQSCYGAGYDFGSATCSSICGLEVRGCQKIGFTRTAPNPLQGQIFAAAATSETVYVLSHFDPPLPDEPANKLLIFDGQNWAASTEPATLGSNALWVNGAHIVLVGDEIGHYDGSQWTADPGSDEVLRAVAGNSPTDLYAVGDGGRILHYDGVTWSSVNTTGVTADLYAIHVEANGRAVAVGAGGTILRLDGTWTDETDALVTSNDLRDIWADVNGTYYGVGAAGTVLDNSTGAWEVRDLGVVDDLIGIAGRGPGNLVAISANQSLHYDGISWTVFASPIEMTSVAASDSGFLVSNPNGLHLFEGITWAEPAPTVIQQSWVLDRSTVFVANNGDFVARFDGTWQPAMQVGTGISIAALSGTSEDNVYAVGLGVHRYDGGQWTEEVTGLVGQTYVDVWVAPTGEVFALGASVVAVRDDQSAWSSEAMPTSMRAIAGSAANDVYAVGAAQTVMKYDGDAWTSLPPPPTGSESSVLLDVAVIDGDVYVVSSGRKRLYVYDGSEWSVTEQVAQANLQVVAGTSANDIFVGTVYGGDGIYTGDAPGYGLYHYDGVRWSQVRLVRNLGVDELSAAADAVVVGVYGGLLLRTEVAP